MRVLVIGGSGLVGSMTMPYLAAENDLTIFDLQPPSAPATAYIQGDLTRYEQLAAAMRRAGRAGLYGHGQPGLAYAAGRQQRF